MGPNYRRHLEYELRIRTQAADNLLHIANDAEREWKSMQRRRQICQQVLDRLIKCEGQAVESFRKAHRDYIETRQLVGELQDELFGFEEDEERWLH